MTRSFCVQALKVHPDKPGGDPQKFQQLASAYEALQAWEHPFLSGDVERQQAQRVAQRLCAAAAQLVRETPGAAAVRAELGAETGDAPAAGVQVRAVGAAGQLLATRHMASAGVLMTQLPSGPGGWAPTARHCWPTMLALQKLQQQADGLPGAPGCLWPSEQGLAVLSLQRAAQLAGGGGTPPPLLSPAQLAALGSGQEADQVVQGAAGPPSARLPPPLRLLGGPETAASEPSAGRQAAAADGGQGGGAADDSSSVRIVASGGGAAEEMASAAQDDQPAAGLAASQPAKAGLPGTEAGQGQQQLRQRNRGKERKRHKKDKRQQQQQREGERQQGKRGRQQTAQQQQREGQRQQGKQGRQQTAQQQQEEEEQEEVNAVTRQRRRRRLMELLPAASAAAPAATAAVEACRSPSQDKDARETCVAAEAVEVGEAATLAAQRQQEEPPQEQEQPPQEQEQQQQQQAPQEQEQQQQQQAPPQPSPISARQLKRKRGAEAPAEGASNQPAAAVAPAATAAEQAAASALAASAAAPPAAAAGNGARTTAAAQPSLAAQLQEAAVPVLQALCTFRQAAVRQLAGRSGARLKDIKCLTLEPEAAASQGLTLRAPVERLAGQLLHSLLPVLVATGGGAGRQLPAVLDPSRPAEETMVRCCPHAGGNPSCLAQHVEGLPGLLYVAGVQGPRLSSKTACNACTHLNRGEAIPNGQPGTGTPLRPLPESMHALEAAQLAQLVREHLLGIQAAICSGSNPFIPALRRSDGSQSFEVGQYRSSDARDSALAHIEQLLASAATAAAAPQPPAATCSLQHCAQRLVQLAPLLRQRGCLPELTASIVKCSGQLPCCQGLGEARLVLVGVMTYNTHCTLRPQSKPLCCACWDAKYAVKMVLPTARAGAS